MKKLLLELSLKGYEPKTYGSENDVERKKEFRF